jgi:fatty acid desaturase
VPFWIVRSLFGSLVTFYKHATLVNIYRVIFLQDKNANSARGMMEAKACAKDDIAQLLFFVAVGIATVLWPKVLTMFYWVPVAIAGVLNAHRVIAEHRHVVRLDSSVESMLATTLTHTLSLPVQSILYPLNIGYHEAHHLFPTLKLEALNEANALLKSHS